MNTIIAFSFSTLKENFYNDFIVDNRWKWLVDGLGVTLKVTLMASYSRHRHRVVGSAR
jgi:hypothetical protein